MHGSLRLDLMALLAIFPVMKVVKYVIGSLLFRLVLKPDLRLDQGTLMIFSLFLNFTNSDLGLVSY